MKKLLFVSLFMAVFSICSGPKAAASQRNMLPRFPEIIVEKGLSESFKVVECNASVKIDGSEAESSVKASLKNVADKPLRSSVKFRILYPTSESQIRLKINGKNASFSKSSPRHEFELQPQESINFEISARQQINYSIESLRKALRQEEEEKQKDKRKKFLMSDFTSLFEREKFGRRFMVGSLISKWGVFPIDFSEVNISISVPSDFTIVAPDDAPWKTTTSGRTRTYTTSDTQAFSAAVFLPEPDKEEFIQSQKVLTSEKFMH